MNTSRLLSILTIVLLATGAWLLLGATLWIRSDAAAAHLGGEVQQVWGPGLAQPHLEVMELNPHAKDSPPMSPASSRVEVALLSSPTKRGLLWHRTYDVKFHAQYVIANRSDQSVSLRVRLRLPSKTTSYENFTFQLAEGSSQEVTPANGVVETVFHLEPNTSLPLTVGYEARGTTAWTYQFPTGSRVRDFTLQMTTNFADINFPISGTSPKSRQTTGHGAGWLLEWQYKDVIDARNIAMEMPKLLSAGPVISRITFYAPLSLSLFFAVLIVFGISRNRNLHPVTYAFLAAGFFSFHLLLSYLGDLLPLHLAFLIAAGVSLFLVSGYIHAVAGKTLSGVAAIAQTAYMVIFSYSFFFDGLTGITLTVTGIVSLWLLMQATAKLNWEELFPGGSLPSLKWRAKGNGEMGVRPVA